MAALRSDQIDLDATPYYHCMVRCVRRAFLCGADHKSGKDFEHRKAWLRDRVRFLADIFTIDVFAYAFMSNHLHLVLCVDAERAAGLTEAEVIERHTRLFPTTRAKLEALASSPEEHKALVASWRARLCDLSWMMRAINEYIARKANGEDDTGGRFWESRFRCQPILDEGGLLTCMAYVDLNPIRAGVAKTLRGAAFTSVQERLRKRRALARDGDEEPGDEQPPDLAPDSLAPFQDQVSHSPRQPIPAGLDDYLALLQWTGRQVAPGKKGTLAKDPPELLAAHGFDPHSWLESLRDSRLAIATRLGSPRALAADARRRGKRWCRGVGSGE